VNAVPQLETELRAHRLQGLVDDGGAGGGHGRRLTCRPFFRWASCFVQQAAGTASRPLSGLGA
jgi:hypothetical protein